MEIIKYKTLLTKEKQCEIFKELSFNYKNERFDQPDKIYKMLCEVFQLDKQTEEYMYLLCFNTKGKLLGVFELSHGTVNCSLCSTREIFQKALLCNASQIVLAHNHPSGDVIPSNADVDLHIKVRKASEIMDIPLLDSIIVGDDFWSLKESGC